MALQAATLGSSAGGAPPSATFPPPAQTAPSAAERRDRLLALATEHEQAGRLEQAEQLLNQLLAEAPDRHGAVQLLGIIAFRKNRVADSVRLMQQSIALAPGMALCHRNICEIYRTLGRLD